MDQEAGSTVKQSLKQLDDGSDRGSDSGVYGVSKQSLKQLDDGSDSGIDSVSKQSLKQLDIGSDSGVDGISITSLRNLLHFSQFMMIQCCRWI